MLQTFCYLCIKKPMTLPHTPLRLLKHRTKNTYEPPKARTTKRTTKSTNPKNEPRKERPKSTNPKNEPRKERPKARTEARTTKRTTERTNPEERTTKRTTKSTNPKNEPRKERPKSTSQKAQTQPQCFKPASQPRCLQARLSKPQSTASAPNCFLAPQNAILPLS